MHYLILPALAILACVAAVSAGVYPVYPYGYDPYVPPLHQPGYSTGGEYVDQGFSKGSGGNRGSGYQKQGSNSYYNQGEEHNRVKQVLESESSSKHSFGGSSQGSEAGRSGESWSSYGDGHLRRGGGYVQSGYFV